MATINMKELLEAGVHFGHLTRKWNPKMKGYIFGQRNGIHIMDLQHTLRGFRKANTFVTEMVSRGGKVLFVGTKRQAQEAIRESAERAGMPYVTERWLGGTLTNYQTIMSRVQRLKELERLDSDPRFENLTKKERMLLVKERDKLLKMLSGIRDMNRVPTALFVVDLNREKNCIREAQKLGIPVVALVDTNCDPEEADYAIPANDDSVRSIQLFSGRIADAVMEGRDMYQALEQERAAQQALDEKIGRDTGAIKDEEKPHDRAKAPGRRDGAGRDRGDRGGARRPPGPGGPRKPGTGTGKPRTPRPPKPE